MTLKVGATGPNVGELHQRLVEAGEEISDEELRLAYFGRTTLIAVQDFQARHVDAKGRPLEVDGVVGPSTMAALADPKQPVEAFIAAGWRSDASAAPCPEAAAAVVAALGMIGAREVPPGSNRGPVVDKFGGDGQPWCAYFVSWCWAQNPSGSPFGTKASALKLHSFAKTSGKLLLPDSPVLPGDIGILLRAGGRGHVELVCAPEWEGLVSFVGGNVANACRGTVRKRTAFQSYFRPIR